MKKFLKVTFYTMTAIIAGWCVLTIVVERTGPSQSWNFGDINSTEKVILVYDPDPFFNLDEQVCKEFGKVLSENGISARVVTVAAAREITLSSFNMYIFCANTYNWGPDLAVSNYIKEQKSLNNKPVIAITLGSGSTTLSQERLEQLIVSQGGKIMDSRSIWLLRPNDENKSEESNIRVALSKTRTWATSMAQEIRNLR
jgi:hypothetical protein